MNFELQGTEGCVELDNSSGEGGWGQGRLYLTGEGGDEKWSDFDEWIHGATGQGFLPPDFRTGSEANLRATKTGHNGSDYYVTASFIAACMGASERAEICSAAAICLS